MLGEYRKLLASRQGKLLLAAKGGIFLPEIAMTLPLTLAIYKLSGNYQTAALALTLYTVAGLISGTFWASWVTKLKGPSSALFIVLGFLHMLFLGGFVLMLHELSWRPIYLAMLPLAGFMSPPLLSFIRRAWQEVGQNVNLHPDPEQTDSLAHGFENATTEMTFIFGPLLAALILALKWTYPFLLLISASALIATLFWALFEKSHLPPAPESLVKEEGGLLAHRRMLWIPLLLAVLWVMAWSIIDLASIAVSNQAHMPYFAGIWIAMTAVGGAAGGLAYGSSEKLGKNIHLECLIAFLSMQVFVVIPLWGGDHPYLILAPVLLAGLASALAYAGLFVWIDRIVHANQRPAAYALLGSSFGLGAALGPLPAGFLLDHANPMWAMLGANLCTLLALALVGIHKLQDRSENNSLIIPLNED